MHAIDIHQRAVATANSETYQKFCVHGPYVPGSPEHDFWIVVFDRASQSIRFEDAEIKSRFGRFYS